MKWEKGAIPFFIVLNCQNILKMWGTDELCVKYSCMNYLNIPTIIIYVDNSSAP